MAIPYPYNFIESSSPKCRLKIENEEQFEKHYRAMSVKIVTWVCVLLCFKIYHTQLYY